MAITNASDLLVYAKTTDPAKQKTRIYVKTVDPISVPDDSSTGNVKILNIVNASGKVKDTTTADSANDGASLLTVIKTLLVDSNSYEASSDAVSGDYTYRDFTNGATGIVPTLEIVSNTATLNENAVIIEIRTPGSSEIFDPVSFGTNASFSSTVETRDITHKDSGGFTEVMSSTKSFEISSESLQTINPDTPLDGTDFFHELKERDKVKLAFSDRIRNIIRTNLTQSGVDGFNITGITQTNLQDNPFPVTDNRSGETASKISVSGNGSFKNINYSVDSARLEGKNVTWTFYVKADSTSSVTFYADKVGDTPNAITPSKIEILEGSQTLSDLSSNNLTLSNLDSTYSRIRLTYNNMSLTNTTSVAFRVFPGASNQNQTAGDSVIVSSWQIEFSDQATDYQDPTTIKSFQGEALVTSVSYDAGVEDNLTCSATFTGTGDIFINGLGPELIGDTGFDLPNDGNNPSSSYWEIGGSGASVIEDGYFKLITVGSTANTFLRKQNILTEDNYYLLTYTVATTPSGTGGMALEDTSEGGSTNIPLSNTPGTHKLQFRAGKADFTIVRSTNPSTRWLSSISLKKVF